MGAYMDEPVLGAGGKDEGLRSQHDDLVDDEACAEVPADRVADASISVESEAAQKGQIQEAAPKRDICRRTADMADLHGRALSCLCTVADCLGGNVLTKNATNPFVQGIQGAD